MYLTTPGASLATATPTLANVAYQDASPASGADSYTVDYGVYELRVTPAGTKTVIFDGPLAAKADDDLLLVMLPKSSAANDIKVLDIPADTGQANFELPG